MNGAPGGATSREKLSSRTLPLGWVMVFVGIGIPLMNWAGDLAKSIWTLAGNVPTKAEFLALETRIAAERAEDRKKNEEGFKKSDEAIAKTVEVLTKLIDARLIQAKDAWESFSNSNRKGIEVEIAGSVSKMETNWAGTASKVDVIYKLVTDGGVQISRSRK